MAGATQGNGVTRGGEYVYNDIALHCIDGRDIVCIGWMCMGYTLRFLYLGVWGLTSVRFCIQYYKYRSSISLNVLPMLEICY
jgi:hypothetical protein